MSMLSGIAVAVAMVFFAIAAEALLTEGELWKATTGSSKEMSRGDAAIFFVVAVISAVLAGIAQVRAPITAHPVIWTTVVLVIFGIITAWWMRDGGRWRELGVFMILWGLTAIPLWTLVPRFSGTMGGLIWLVPSTLFGAMAVKLLLEKAAMAKLNGKGGTLQRVLAIVLAVAIALGDVITIVVVLRKNRAPQEEPPQEIVEETVEGGGEIVEPVVVPRWYQINAARDDAEPGNFGPAPTIDWETAEGKDVWNVLKDVVFGGGAYERPDPNVGISLAYYNDNVTGKRMLTYTDDNDTESIKNQILYLIGAMGGAEANRADSGAYDRLMSQVVESIEKYAPTYKVYTTAELEKLGVTVKDQLYADLSGIEVADDSGAPEKLLLPVVWECEMAPEDHFLYVSYHIKGRHVEMWFHVECLFQPCNPSECMKVEVKPNPVKPVKPKNSTNNGGGNKTTPTDGGGSKINPDPPKDGGGAVVNPAPIEGGGVKQQAAVDGGGNKVTLPVTNPKDVTKGTDSGRNIKPGPDEFSGVAVGSTVGKFDDNYTNSAQSGATNQQLEQKADMLEKFQEHLQLPGGSENIPLATRENTKVDQTEDKEMKSKEDKPVSVNGGQTISNTGDSGLGTFKPSDDISNGANVSVSEVGIAAENRRKQLQEEQAKQATTVQGSGYTSYNNAGYYPPEQNYSSSSYGGLDYGATR